LEPFKPTSYFNEDTSIIFFYYTYILLLNFKLNSINLFNLLQHLPWLPREKKTSFLW
jgi:hypothetical protein